MKRLALALLATACGGAPPQPETIRRPVEDKAAIAPPPPAPEVPIPGQDVPSDKTSDDSDEGKLTLEEALYPQTTLEFAEPAGAPANARLIGSVLVWIDAPFYVAPKDSAPSFKLATLDSRKKRAGHAVPMRVVASKGAFLEVETPITDSLRNNVLDCAWFATQSQYDIDRWRLYVKRADLAPVITKKFAKTFRDGSRIDVGPGQPILPLTDGTHAVTLHPIWAPVALPAGVAGYAYPTPPRPKEPKADEPESTFAPKHVLYGRTVGIADTSQPVRGAYRPRAETIETKGDVVGFPLEDTCGKATVIAKASEVRPYEAEPANGGMGGGMGMGVGTVMGAERWYIPKGTRLVVEGGTASATTAMELSVPKPEAGAKQVCVERSLFASSSYVFGPKLERVENASLKLCVSTRSVKHEKAQPGFGLGKGGYGVGSGRGMKRPAEKK